MIHNTHYNLIDTYILAFGYDFWKELTKSLWETSAKDSNMREYFKRNFGVGVSSNMEHHRYYSEKLISFVDWEALEEEYNKTNDRIITFHNQHKFTLCELFVWAMTEGRISEHWGYGFK